MEMADPVRVDERDGRRGCLLVHLDEAFLVPLQVLLHSMRHYLKNSPIDILIFTNDKKILDNHFVQRIARRTVYTSADDMAAMPAIRTDAVQQHLRIPIIGKYTFLRFFCFDDYGYDFHINLDSDMIFLDPDFSLTSIVGDHDFAVAPTMGRRALQLEKINESTLSAEEAGAVLSRVLRIAARNHSPKRGFNSGLWFAGRRMLGEHTVRRLFEYASTESFKYEQEVLHRHIQSIEGLRFRSLSVWHNFPALAARAIGPENFEIVRSQIKILHFNSAVKPWQQEQGSTDWLDRMWWEAHDQSREWVEAIEAGRQLGDQ
jgi:lipopolysaccharide biosynthesis glycosyltransferase